MPRKPYRQFEGYTTNGRKLTSNCEVCGIEVPFVHILADDSHSYCKDCEKLLRKLQRLEEKFAQDVPDDEQDEEVEP